MFIIIIIILLYRQAYSPIDDPFPYWHFSSFTVDDLPCMSVISVPCRPSSCPVGDAPSRFEIPHPCQIHSFFLSFPVGNPPFLFGYSFLPVLHPGRQPSFVSDPPPLSPILLWCCSIVSVKAEVKY